MPVTFGSYSTYIDPRPHVLDAKIAAKTMLYHGGAGVFDGVAGICYEDVIARYASDNMADGDPDANQALRVLKWQRQNVDGSGPIFVTETAGNPHCAQQNCGDTFAAGEGLATFQLLASQHFATPINPAVPNELFLRSVNGYILPDSNPAATNDGWHEIRDNFLAGWRTKQFL